MATLHHVQRDVISQLLAETSVLDRDVDAAFLGALAAEHELEESFYVVDVAKVIQQFLCWRALLPRITPYFAVKCNPDRALMAVLAALGTGFDCASKDEIDRVLSLGVDSTRIVYANPCKSRAHLKHARAKHVDHMTFDCEDELAKIAREHPDARLVLRIVTDDSKSMCAFSCKFGARLEDVPHLLTVAQKLRLNVVGVSFHVGSGCGDASAYTKALCDSRHVFDIAMGMGFDMYLLDIGGGFPGHFDAPPTYMSPHDMAHFSPKVTFEEIARVVNEGMDEFFADLMPHGLRIIAEPGRYFMSASHTLALRINTVKKSVKEGEKGDVASNVYYVDDGVYQSFNCIIFDHYLLEPLPLLSDDEIQKRPHKPCCFFGPTCDSLDKLGADVMFPEMREGEWVYFKNMGAYTRAATSPFNGFGSQKVFYVVSPISTAAAAVVAAAETECAAALSLSHVLASCATVATYLPAAVSKLVTIGVPEAVSAAGDEALPVVL